MNGTILVIAAAPSIGRNVMRLLTELGFTSRVRVIGVQSKEPVNGILRAFAVDREPVEIKLDECVVALVDGVLFGEFRGWDLVPFLKAAGVECVGISNMYHDMLRQSGAAVSPDLVDTYAFLRNGLLEMYAAGCSRKQVHSHQ